MADLIPVPDFRRPAMASPRDQMVGQDEFGRQIMQTIDGVRYLGTDFAPEPQQGGRDRGMLRNLLDNIIGFDDEVVTPGERLGAGVQEFAGGLLSDPLGTGAGILQGGYETIERAMAPGATPMDVMGAAGMAMGGGGLLGRAPQNAVGMFAGRRAQTADLSALRRAERMTEQGASRDDIWQETGWVQGNDGDWRFEIDDSGSQMRPMASILAGQPIRLGNAFSHIALSRAYPDLFDPAQLTYRYDEGSVAGAFRPGRQGNPSTIQVRAPQQADMADARSVTLHELQHGVQRIEGWNTGSNTALRGQVGDLVSFRPTGDQILDAIRSGDKLRMSRLRANLPGGFEAYERMNQFFPTATADEIIAAVRPAAKEEAFGAYERTPGEVEGRLTQAREWMTAADRRAVPPWQSTVPYEVSDRSLENARNYLAQFGLLAQ